MNSATLSLGKPGVLHGTKTYVMQDSDGQVTKVTSNFYLYNDSFCIFDVIFLLSFSP